MAAEPHNSQPPLQFTPVSKGHPMTTESEPSEKKFESAVLTLASRWFTVIGFPAMFALSLWFGGKIIERFDSFILETRQEFRNTDRRINGFDIRLTGVERDIRYLQERP